MDILVIAFIFAIGIVVWYMIFYFRYEQRGVVDEMRTRLESNAQDIQAMKIDLIEYTQQNKILKEKANDLLVKNDDLSKIVAEMSRYYQYLKNAYDKAKDLAEFLKVFESESDHKAQWYKKPKLSDGPWKTVDLQRPSQTETWIHKDLVDPIVQDASHQTKKFF